MAVRKILRMGHPGLRVQAQPVPEAMLTTEPFARLLTDMHDTLADYGGIGLAATQINEPLQVALIDLPGGPSRYGELPKVPSTIFINPKVEVLDNSSASYWEGCLSVPGLRGLVERPQHIQVSALDVHGNPLSFTFEGFAATVFQHEFDHLAGKLYVDRILTSGHLAFDEEFERYLAPPSP